MEITNIINMLWAAVLILLLLRIAAFHKPSPPQKRSRDMGGCMTIGTREFQEDCYGLEQSRQGVLGVLADGMGKSFGGRIASRVAVETFQDVFEDYNAFDNPPYFFRKAFQSANREILKTLDNGQNGAASVGAAVIMENKLYYAVVGNVKICVYRSGELVPVSTGHTLDQLAEQGFRSGKISREAAVTMLEDHRLYNYVGRDEFRDVELYDTPITLYPEDVVVLMSDGVFETLSWKDIEDVLATKKDCRSMAFEVIEKINRLNEENKDNASLVLIRTGERALQ